MLDHRLQGAEPDVAGGPLHDPVGPLVPTTVITHVTDVTHVTHDDSLSLCPCRSPSGRTTRAAASRRTRAHLPARPSERNTVSTRPRCSAHNSSSVRPGTLRTRRMRGVDPSGALRAIAAASSRPDSRASPGSHRRTTRPWSNADWRAERRTGQRHLGHHGLRKMTAAGGAARRRPGTGRSEPRVTRRWHRWTPR